MAVSSSSSPAPARCPLRRVACPTRVAVAHSVARVAREAVSEEVENELHLPHLLLHVTGVVAGRVEVDRDGPIPAPERVRVDHRLAHRAPAVVLADDEENLTELRG